MHDHTISLRLPPALPEILADRERIVQVMMNIVSNSIKYTPNGGAIMISAGASGKWVWMEVDDNGIGIPQEDRGRIFERFYRVDKARSRQSGGTGLGLSIAKEIVDSHQDRLFLVDKDAPGLTIRLELQVDGPQEDHRHEMCIRDSPGAGLGHFSAAIHPAVQDSDHPHRASHRRAERGGRRQFLQEN